ncbi:hypothetical protein P4124_23450 [Pseudomonas aeruginosa]|nr:hypothetical protein [Pseudomonas aeruginosa]
MICWLIAEWVTCSSLAAWLMLPSRATASKLRSAVREEVAHVSFSKEFAEFISIFFALCND